MAARFGLTSVEIEDAALTALTAARLRGEPAVATQADLFAAARAQRGHALAALTDKIEPSYGWDDLVLPAMATAQLHEICDRVAHRAQVHDHWGFDRVLSYGRGISALFSGPVGHRQDDGRRGDRRTSWGWTCTRSTWRRSSASTSARPRRTSTGSSPPRPSADAILFFDEADALFGKRSDVQATRTTATPTSRSATCCSSMERYDGLAILATNLRKNLDEAFIRRLQFVVEFPFPDEADRRAIWEVCFPAEAPRDRRRRPRPARASGSGSPAATSATSRSPRPSARPPTARRSAWPTCSPPPQASTASWAGSHPLASPMFHDLDASLQALLDDAAAPTEVRTAEISFDTPDKGFAPTNPTLDLFLVEVQENRALRVRGEPPVREHVNGQFIEHHPPLRVDCTYLVTAWSAAAGGVRAQEEHRLLGLALLWMSRFPRIDDRYLQGTMVGQPFPLPMTVAQTPEGQSLGQFWSAMGVPPRAAFAVSVTISMAPFPDPDTYGEVKNVVLEPAWLTTPSLAGRVLDTTLAPVAGAVVTVQPGGARSTADADGRFGFDGLEFGSYTLGVVAAGHPDLHADVQYQRDRQVHNVIVANP